MKVALISPLTGAYSGAHEYAVQLKHSLEIAGHECTIFSIAGIGNCPIPNTTKLFLKKAMNNVDLLKGYDVIHFTTVSENSKLSPRFMPYSAQFKYFVTIHSCEHDLQSASGWQNIVVDAKGIIFTSEGNRQYYIKHYPHLVREDNSYAVDMPYVPKNPEHRVYEKEPLALCLSRFISYKKIREFLLLAKDFPEMIFNALATIKTSEKSYVNGMITMAYYNGIAKKTLDIPNAILTDYYDLVKATGKSMGELKEEYLKKAKYLVDLSCFEHDRDRVQYTTLEAMDFGCVPIFHRNFFGQNLVIMYNGVPVLNELEAIEAIKNLKSNPDAQKFIIENNFKFLDDRYGDPNTQKYLEIYRK